MDQLAQRKVGRRPPAGERRLSLVDGVEAVWLRRGAIEYRMGGYVIGTARRPTRSRDPIWHLRVIVPIRVGATSVVVLIEAMKTSSAWSATMHGEVLHRALQLRLDKPGQYRRWQATWTAELLQLNKGKRWTRELSSIPAP